MILLRKIREEKGLMQKELSEMTGVPRSTISAYERNARTIKHPNMNHLKKLAIALEVDITELFDEVISKSNDKVVGECKNQACPLNKNCKCINDVVLEGRKPCFGKDEVKAKRKKVDFNNTQALFID